VKEVPVSQRLVVVGGGAAGMSAASAARLACPAREIVVLESGGHVGYGMCGIPYYLSGLVPGADALLTRSPSFFREEQHIDVRLHSYVTALDPERRIVRYVRGGRATHLGYDRIVLASGAMSARPPVAGLDDPRVFGVRTLEDAISLRSLLDAGLIAKALVVGAGYAGLEMAEALRAQGVAVIQAEQAPTVAPSLDPPMAELVAEEVRRHGVDLRAGTRLWGIRRAGSELEAEVGDVTVTVDAVIVAAGVRARAGIAARAGAVTGPGGGLLVDDRMRSSLPDVYGAGDCIAAYHRVLGRPAYVPQGPVANRTGRVAGIVAAGGDMRFDGVLGTEMVKVFDLAVARTGLTLTEARAEGLPAVATDVLGRSCAEYYPGAHPVTVRLVHERGGRLLGAQLIGGDGTAKRIDVVAVALQAGFDVAGLMALDLSYAPPFAAVHEPVLSAARAAARVPAAGAAVLAV
jgi:NADPH-dependent 2,4-dienoyl-CoA reductase/sulfur reductase-like enzyme